MKEKKTSKEKLKLNSQKVKEREIKIKYVKMSLLIIILFLILLYFILRIIYETGNFTITMDEKFALKNGLAMYETLAEKEDRRILKATKLDFIDNISVKWIPQDIDKTGEGSHNGENYLAYTFYIENKGADTINYWYEMPIDDVVKNVDKAIRIMLFLNGEKTIYAKPNEHTNEAEAGTVKFFSDEEVCVEKRAGFAPGDIDKFTIVIFIEGDDPDCRDELIGGGIKMHLDIKEEHIKNEK